MALASHTSRLKLGDADWKSLGVSHIQAGGVACSTGLTEGADYEIDYPRGLIRRLRVVAEGLHAFTIQYDDRAEIFAAADTERQTSATSLKQQASQARTRLAEIQQGGFASAAARDAAIVDLATILDRVVRYLVARA